MLKVLSKNNKNVGENGRKDQSWSFRCVVKTSSYAKLLKISGQMMENVEENRRKDQSWSVLD